VTAPGFFLVLEGGEGSGKSTVAAALEHAAAAQGRQVLRTREPGGTPVAEAIRDLLLSQDLPEADPWCEALLFAAARADHVGTAIRPALERGAVVICDRFVDSSAAYQGLGRGLGVAAVREANAAAMAGTVPDLTVVLDIDPAIGLQRAVGHNRMEARSLAFHREVRQAFLDFAAAEPERYCVIDAEQPLASVLAAATAAFEQQLVEAAS
jgi:dTMP kinase